MRKSRSYAAAAVLLSLALVGCGGSDALTAKQWRTAADKICVKGRTDGAKIGQGLSQTSPKADLDKAVGELADLYAGEADDIDALKAPDSLSKDADALVKALRSGIKVMRDQGADMLTATENPLADASEKAKALGLKECGSAA